MVGSGARAVTGEEFAQNASRWLSRPGFPAAAWVEQVPASRRAAYERRIGHQLVARDQRGRILPVEPRSSYLPATLVSGNAPVAVPGIDLGGEPGTAAALARARGLGDPARNPARWHEGVLPRQLRSACRQALRGEQRVRLADRLAAVEGQFRVHSPADGGTLVAASIPLSD